MKNNSVSITVDESTALKIISFYKEYQKDNPNEYIRFFAKDDINGIVISLYFPKKGKTESSCVFQGENAEHESLIWSNKTKTVSSKPIKVNQTTKSLFPQIGSDEVGTGDFFGPISVCSAHVSKEDLPLLKELGVTDSKMLSDDSIMQIGPILIKKIKYSQLLLENEKYNEVHDNGENMNMMKAKMHNRCILNLVRLFPSSYIYQDQFAQPKTYFSYLKNEKEIVKNITFSTKGELKYISVAVASCIARYSFLRNMDKLCKKYNCSIPFGCSSAVEDFAVWFATKFGIDELNKITKHNFITYKKVIGRINK